jgi:hypothetical protein
MGSALQDLVLQARQAAAPDRYEQELMKLSQYIDRLLAFQVAHGDLELFSPDPSSDIFGEPALIGVQAPPAVVAADTYFDGNVPMVMRPRGPSAIRAANRDKFPIGQKVALLVGRSRS